MLENDGGDNSSSDDDGCAIAGSAYGVSEVLSAVRRACLARVAVPTLCGASLRGVGVEPLLDAVSTFLPSPLDRPRPTGVVRPASSGGRAGGKGAKKRARRGGGIGDRGAGWTESAADAVISRGGDSSGGGGVRLEVDPLRDDLVAFVFKVRRFCSLLLWLLWFVSVHREPVCAGSRGVIGTCSTLT